MAFTFTSITSTKIDVESGTGTLSELYADAIADTPGCMTNPSANVYEVQNNCEIELSGSTDLTIETGDTIQFSRTSNGTTWDVQGSAQITFEAGSTYIADVNGTHMGYAYFYGGLDIQGTSGNEVIFDNVGRNLMYAYGLNGKSHNVNYLIARNLVSGSSYGLQFQPSVYSIVDSVTHTYENITVQGGPTEASGNGWLFYWGHGSYHNFTFNNIELTNGNGFLCYATSNLIIDGGTALNGDIDHKYYGTAGVGLMSSHYNTAKNENFGDHNTNQNKTLFKNYTFDDGDLGVYTAGSIGRGAVVYFESCTFQNAERAISVGGIAVMYNPTFTSISVSNYNYISNRNPTVLHARKMTLTVEDSGGSPIEGATVTFRQKEGRETWTCTTDSNGDVLDPSGEPIWLIEREETSNGVFSEWSDGTGNQVHVIEVYKTGYEPHTEEVVMNQDRTKTITLSTETQSGTTLNNVTINSTATIY